MPKISRIPQPRKPGEENEYTKQLREKSLERVIDTKCFLCNVGVRRTARAGMDWFRAHAQTVKHKTKVEENKR